MRSIAFVLLSGLLILVTASCNYGKAYIAPMSNPKDNSEVQEW